MKKFNCIRLLKGFILLVVLSPMFLSAQVALDKQGRSPVSMKFQSGNQPTISTFFQGYRQAYPLSDENQLKELRVTADKVGSHHRYDQYYKGIQINGAQFILHEKNGSIWYANGHLVHGLNIDVNPVITRERALQLALQNVNADVYMWESPQSEAFIKSEQKNPNATFYPSCELKLTSGFKELTRENIRLVYRFDIYAKQPLGRYWVDVDAKTGEIVCMVNRIQNTDITGSGTSLYNGTVPITVDELIAGSSYRLHEYSTRGASIQTYNLQNYWDFDHVVEFESASNNGPWDPVGVSSQYGLEATYDYFWNEHGRNSIDDAGYNLLSYTHYGVNLSNAYWDGTRMTFGDGDGVNFFPLVSLDVCAHELTHGVTQYSSNLLYYCESGALNESFSDIFGNLVEFSKEGAPGIGTGTWFIGEDFSADDRGFRNMANPNEFWNADTYLGNYWVLSNGGDGGGVHSNSGVPNYWFYLLAEGGSGTNDNGDYYDVTGIGLEAAAVIAYNTNNSYLWVLSDFLDARRGSIAAAEAFYGTGSTEALAVAEAWDAVGVYDFETPENDLCENAIELFCNDVVSGTTIGATFDENAPWCDFEHSAKGVWYKFIGNGHTILASMCGGPVYDARMTVYEGSCNELSCVGADDDGCGGYSNLSQMAWVSNPGTEYFILIHGFVGSVGNFQLSISSLDAPAIATEPDAFNLVVPFQGVATDVMSISSVGEDCMLPLKWYIYNTEPVLPMNKYAGSLKDIIHKTNISFPTLFKHDKIGSVGLTHNNKPKTKISPPGPPVLVAGQATANNPNTGSGQQVKSVELTKTITHSIDQSIIGMNSVACWNGIDATTDNSYWRAFDLPEFGISGTFDVSNVEIGVDFAQTVHSQLMLTVNLYTSEGAPFPSGFLNLIGTATYEIGDQTLTMLSLPVTGTTPPGSELVVEIYSPGGNLFFIGSNYFGQTGPSYLSAAECGLFTPVDLADLGFPFMHMVMNVTGTYESVCPWLSFAPYRGITLPGNNGEVAVLVDAAGLDVGNYECGFTISSNANNGQVFIPVTMSVVDVTPPVISVAGPITLWPPNGKYENYIMPELVVSVIDDVDGTIPVSNVNITSASSDEPDNAPGNGDGNTINDIKIATNCKSVDLRSERQGVGNGRVYKVNMSVSDAAGNVGTASCLVTVPHDQKHPAIDDGPDHTIYSNCANTVKALTPFVVGNEDNKLNNNELTIYPNPFSGNTSIEFSLKESNIAKLTIYNAYGIEVASLYKGMADAGQKYTINFNGSILPEGVYFCRLESRGSINTIKKMLIIK